MTKICSKCKIEKDLSEFYKDKTRKDKLRPTCKSCGKKYCQDYYLHNKNEYLKYQRIYRNNHKQKIRKRDNKYKENRLSTDINFRILHNLRRRLNHALHGKNKSQTTMTLLGCTIPKLINHLESQFKSGMSWQNYGYRGWHVDHIKPCVYFDLSKSSEQKICFNYKNLQPLWMQENLIKKDK